MVRFTRRKTERNKLSREVYSNIIRITTVKSFERMISINTISNYPISVSYISNAENIYRRLMESIKGNSTRSEPSPLIKDEIKISSEI